MKFRIKGETRTHNTGMAAAMHHFCGPMVVVLKPGETESVWMDIVSGRIVTIERVDVPEVHRSKDFWHEGRRVVMA